MNNEDLVYKIKKDSLEIGIFKDGSLKSITKPRRECYTGTNISMYEDDIRSIKEYNEFLEEALKRRKENYCWKTRNFIDKSRLYLPSCPEDAEAFETLCIYYGEPLSENPKQYKLKIEYFGNGVAPWVVNKQKLRILERGGVF